MLASYLPHPFFVGSALIFVFIGWTFISIRRRRRDKPPHPKTRRPALLALESGAIGLAWFALTVGAALLWADPGKADAEYVTVMAIMSFSIGTAYFAAPYLGYNLLWNSYVFGQDRAIYLALAVALSLLVMGLRA